MSVYGDHHCYHIDGTWVSDHVPCSRDTQITQCCQPDDTCTTTGFCIGANLTAAATSSSYYSSSCTDQAFGPGCQNYCPSANKGAGIRRCSDTKWCCIFNSDVNCCIGNSTFTADLGRNITTDERMSLNASSPASGSGISAGAAAGIGIGVALGILLIGCIAAFVTFRILRNRQIRKIQERGLPPGYSHDGKMMEVNWKPWPAELLDWRDGRHELQEHDIAIELPSTPKPVVERGQGGD